MNWVHSTFYIALVLKSVLSAQTNPVDITSAERKTEITDENVQTKTSEIEDGVLKDNLKKVDHLEVELLKSKINTQSAVNISSNDKNNLRIDKEDLKNIVLSDSEQMIDSENSPKVGNYTLKSNENAQNNDSDGNTKAGMSLLDIENDEVYKNLNKKLINTKDQKSFNEVMLEIIKYLLKVKNISKSKIQEILQEYDKAESAKSVTPSESRVLRTIKDIAAAAGNFLDYLIKIPFRMFAAVKKSIVG